MRSHLTVAVLAFAAGALMVWLVVFEGTTRVKEPLPLEPAKNAVANVSLAADTTTSAAPTASAAVAPSPSTPAETHRAPKAERRTTCLLGGYVRSSGESSQPVAHAYVGLYLPASFEDGPTSSFGQWSGPPERFSELRQLLTYVYSEDDGRFSFDELQAGTYIVHVEYGPLVTASTAPQTLAPGEVRGGLDVLLPLAGSLAGQILAPPDTSFDTWRVALEPSDKQQMHAMSVEGREDNRILKVVDDDGTFELGPAEAGLHHVLLVRPNRPVHYGEDAGLPIGEVMIVAGQTVKQTFDLRQGFPGSLNVTLHIPAFERSEHPNVYWRVPFTIKATPQFLGAKVESMSVTGRLAQPAVLGPLEPGMWSLRVQSPISAWTFTLPIEQRVEAGQAHDVVIEIPLYTATLTCLDSATGGTLANTEVMVWCGEEGSGTKTDAEGRLQLQYPLGTYMVAAYIDEDGQFDYGLKETFDWQEDGPHPGTVKLLRPATAPR